MTSSSSSSTSSTSSTSSSSSSSSTSSSFTSSLSSASSLVTDTRDIVGSWGTKIEAVVRKVLKLTLEDSTSKILIFSQWEDVLTIVERALDDNRLNPIRIKGSHKINFKLNQFKTNSKYPVLLLPLKSAANGLNLIEANHVIMIEPLLNFGIERQAINRVHRIGQTRETHVHRFIVDNTIEIGIAKRAKELNTSIDGGSSSSSSSSSQRSSFKGQGNHNDQIKNLTMNELRMLFGLR